MKVQVTSTVAVELKEGAFTEEFLSEFRESFFPFHTRNEHAEHIAQLVAREMVGEIEPGRGESQFVEGYGAIGAFVKSAIISSVVTEIQPDISDEPRSEG